MKEQTWFEERIGKTVHKSADGVTSDVLIEDSATAVVLFKQQSDTVVFNDVKAEKAEHGKK